MIALAVADSPLVRNLLVEGILEIDYVETHGVLADTLLELLPQQPLLLHNGVYDWSLGHPKALDQQGALSHTLYALTRTRAPWLSVHLGFSAAKVAFRESWLQPQSPVLSRDELLSNICNNVQKLAAAIPVPLILENMDYYPNGAYEHICDPEFIATVLDQTGVGMLLDVAHARTSATQLGWSTEDYLAHLPLGCVQQLHISGPRWRNGVLEDIHEPLLEEDYLLLQHVLRLTDPRVLTFEYSKDEVALREQLSQLRDILNRAITTSYSSSEAVFRGALREERR